MTCDDIIKLADDVWGHTYWSPAQLDRLERFATLVAAEEREACAEILDRNAQVCQSNSMLRDVLEGNAAAIRARRHQ